MTSRNETLLGKVTDLVSFLRWRVGPAGDDELRFRVLANDPDALAASVASTGAGRGSDDPQVSASLWWQSYAYRIAGTTLACWILSGAAPDPAAEGTAIGFARSRPSSVVFDPFAATVDDLGKLVDRLFADHLDVVASSLRARHAIGQTLLWGNTAASIESAFGALTGAEGAPPDLEGHLDLVRAALPRDVTATVELHDAGHRRRTCCLWWKTTEGDGKLCADCSLR